eukprot:2752336-Rhodomonas_salina.2
MVRTRAGFPLALKAELVEAGKDSGVVSVREIKENEIKGNKWTPLATEEKSTEKVDDAPFATWFSESAVSLTHNVDMDKLRIGEAWGDTSTPEPSWNGFCGRGTRKRPPWWPQRKELSGWRKTPRTSHAWGEVIFEEEPLELEGHSNGALKGAAEVAFGVTRRRDEHSAHAWRNAPLSGEVRLATFESLWEKLDGLDTSFPIYGNRRLFDLSSLKEQWGEDDVDE